MNPMGYRKTSTFRSSSVVVSWNSTQSKEETRRRSESSHVHKSWKKFMHSGSGITTASTDSATQRRGPRETGALVPTPNFFTTGVGYASSCLWTRVRECMWQLRFHWSSSEYWWGVRAKSTKKVCIALKFPQCFWNLNLLEASWISRLLYSVVRSQELRSIYCQVHGAANQHTALAYASSVFDIPKAYAGCIKLHIFNRKITKFFWRRTQPSPQTLPDPTFTGEGIPSPRPYLIGAFCASILVSSLWPCFAVFARGGDESVVTPLHSPYLRRIITYTLCLKKTSKLWNGIARYYKDRFWRHLAEMFKIL